MQERGCGGSMKPLGTCVHTYIHTNATVCMYVCTICIYVHTYVITYVRTPLYGTETAECLRHKVEVNHMCVHGEVYHVQQPWSSK